MATPSDITPHNSVEAAAKRCETHTLMGAENTSAALCVGCGREFVDGDRYIEDTSSGFVGAHADPSVDDLMADIFGSDNGMVRFCEGCTEKANGPGYAVKVWHGTHRD